MTASIKHAFNSALADDPTAAAAGEILPSHWNNDHTLTGTITPAQGGTGVSSYAKGDLLAGVAGNALSNLPVGINTFVLTADSAQLTGLRWASPPSGMASYSVINVKNFGAIGNGSADDTVAIQAAFDAAFGSFNSPHGNTYSNPSVYFPAGQYKVSAPLYLTNVFGGNIFGDGAINTSLTFNPASAIAGNRWAANFTGRIDNGTPGIAGTILTVTSMQNGQIQGLTYPAAAGILNATQITAQLTSTEPGGVLGGRGTYQVVVAGVPATTQTLPAGTVFTENGANLTPLIMFNGVQGLRMERMALNVSGGVNPALNTIGIYAYEDSAGDAAGVSHAGAITSANTFIDVWWGGFFTGVLGGFGGSGGNCDNHNFFNCYFFSNLLAGIQLVSFNAVNWNVYGGGASGNASLSTASMATLSGGNGGAAYSCVAGSFSVISGQSCSNNRWDYFNSGGTMHICGGSSEPNGTAQGFAAGTWGVLFNQGTTAISGYTCRSGPQSDIIFVANFEFCGIYQCEAEVGLPSAGPCYIVDSSNGNTVIDGLLAQFASWRVRNHSGINDKIYIRASDYRTQNPLLFSGYTGILIDEYASPVFTVATLPSVSVPQQGLAVGARAFVTDATATTFLSVVAGGGTNKVPVIYNGANWVIG